jgi:hypothetical protein
MAEVTHTRPFRGRALAILAIAGVLALSIAAGPALVWSFDDRAPRNDFVSFYAAPRLLSAGALYSPAKTAEEHARLGVTPDQHSMVCLRLPFYALLLKPIAMLPYRAAYLIWEVASLLAFTASAWLWRNGTGGLTAAGAAWSIPMAYALIRGQDSAFLLLIFSAGIWLLSRKRDLAAGLVLSLCALKWSVFLTLPLLFAARRLRRPAMGFGAGALVIIALSFWAGGANWYRDYLGAVLAPFSSPHTEQMASLNGLVSFLPYPGRAEFVAAAGILVLAWIAMRRARSLECAAAAMLVSGILVSHHAYLYDCVLLFPAALIAARGFTGALRFLGVLMLSPFLFLTLIFPPYSRIAQAGLVLFMASIALGTRHQAEKPVHATGTGR